MERIKDVMVLGGCGGAGLLIAKLLLKDSDVNIIIGDQNVERINQVVKQFNSEFSGNRVRGKKVNALDNNELTKALKSCNLVISCIPITITGIKDGIVKAAFKAGIHYMDLAMDHDKRKTLEQLSGKIKASGKIFIFEGGFVPGIPSMMAHLGAKQFDSVKSAEFTGMFRDNNSTYGSVVELLKYSRDPIYVCKDGNWRIDKPSSKVFDFGPTFGKVRCYPMDQYELRKLPKNLGYKDMIFYTSGVNPRADLIMFILLGTGLYKIKWALKKGAKLIVNSMRKHSKPPFITRVTMEAKGKIGNHNESYKLVVEHEDAYIGTAITTVAGILQLIDGTIKEPGVHIMGHCVDPDRYIEDIKRLGMTVEIERNRI